MRKNTTNCIIMNEVSVAATKTSTIVPLIRETIFSIQATTTGTLTGTFAVQVSNDVTEKSAEVANWTTITLSPALTNPAGSTTNSVALCNPSPYKWMKVVFTFTSGSGNILLTFTGLDY